MSAPRTLAEAQAQCRALGVDLRLPMPANGPRLVNGRPMRINECMDLILPFCPGGGVRVEAGRPEEFPVCVDESVSGRKAAVLVKEAQARAAGAGDAGPSWLLLGVGALALGGLAFWLVRK